MSDKSQLFNADAQRAKWTETCKKVLASKTGLAIGAKFSQDHNALALLSALKDAGVKIPDDWQTGPVGAIAYLAGNTSQSRQNIEGKKKSAAEKAKAIVASLS